jgi:hypothetical protein
MVCSFECPLPQLCAQNLIQQLQTTANHRHQPQTQASNGRSISQISGTFTNGSSFVSNSSVNQPW